jgi:putrescine transport system permease protein
MKRPARLLPRAWLTLVFLFFYVPIVSVVVFSFNESPLVSVWTRFSTRWYVSLVQDRELMQAAWTSLVLALATAFASVFVGAWIGFVMASYRRFRGQALFLAMVTAPMVLPEVVSGIALLLLFVGMEQAIGWPAGRGMTTMWLGHVMLCISYVAITVQARLTAMDRSLVEAAKDLGATPLRVFFDITLPLISQALVAGWLLSFTISLDDVIMSAFLSGPETATLPLVVLSRVRLGLDPEVNALGTVFITAVSVVLIGHTYYQMKREQRQRRLLTAVPAPES